MNTYDFDKTMFYPDSSACFFRFCLRRYPSALLPTLPKSLRMALRYRRGEVSARELKQQLFSFLSEIRDIDEAVARRLPSLSSDSYRFQKIRIKKSALFHHRFINEL